MASEESVEQRRGLIKHIVPAIDGRGGGKPNLAQAGGKNAQGIPDALAAATEWLKQKLV